MKRKELIILRTNFFNDYCYELLSKLSKLSDKDVIVCADESQNFVDTLGFAKVRMGLKSIDRLGLYRPSKAAWLCGDYFYYHVLKKYPHYDFYWMIEPDVYFDFDYLEDFFNPLSRDSHDYLVMHFGERKEGWAWHKTVKNYVDKVYGGPFPLTRLSKKALNFLFLARRDLSRNQDILKDKKWPNDEAFVANFLMSAGFSCSDFNHLGNGIFSTKKSFRTGQPWLQESLCDGHRSNLIYHPVLDKNNYLNKLERHIRMRGVLSDDVEKIIVNYYDSSTFESLLNLQEVALEKIKLRNMNKILSLSPINKQLGNESYESFQYVYR